MSTSVIENLRSLMRNDGYSALIIPMEDPHQSEYIPEHEKRVRFVSSFSGSAGTAVVGLDHSWLWTDGRYFNQASKQLKDGWTLMKMGVAQTPTIPEFLSQHLQPSSAVGVDAKLISITTARDYKGVLEKKGISLKYTKENLVDKVWHDRPQVNPAKHQVRVLGDNFTGKSAKDKLAYVRSKMTQKNAKHLVITALDHIAWLYNIRGTDIEYNPVVISYSIVSSDSATIYIHEEKLDEATRKYLAEITTIKKYEAFFDDLQLISNSMVWLDPSSSAAVYDVFRDSQVVSAENPIVLAKSIKNPVELQGLRNSSLRDAAALVRFFSWLEQELNNGTQMTECEASDKLLSFREKVKDFVSPSFATISSTGPNAAIIHYKPEPDTCAVINKDKIYLCDSGAQYYDGTTDVTRTFHFGNPTAREKQAYTAVLKGHIAFDSLVFPENVTGLQLDAFARAGLWSLGLDYRHGTGHGVGHYLCVHEGPQSVSFRPRSGTHGFQENMTITNEPGYYEDGSFGIRIENILIAVASNTQYNFDGGKFLQFEHITYVPLDKNLIDVSMLTEKEKTWINNYHSECLSKVGPLLDSNESSFTWLKQRTLPL